MTLIRQLPRRLGFEKEAKTEKQVQELLSKGLIKPASGLPSGAGTEKKITAGGFA